MTKISYIAVCAVAALGFSLKSESRVRFSRGTRRG